MKFATLIVMLSLFIVGICGAVIDSTIPTAAPSTGLPTASEPAGRKTTSTTAKPTTVPTTESTTPSTVTTSSTSTTLSPSTTTTTELPTTTAKPPTTTTTSATTTTTTTTTTNAPPTTTVAPPPKEPEVRNWTLTDGKQACIFVEFATQLNVSYTISDNKTGYEVYNLPGDAESNITGSCGNGTSNQNIVIEWTDKNGPNTMNLTFHLNETAKEFSLFEVAFNLSAGTLPNVAKQRKLEFYHVGNAFVTPKDRSYHCTRIQSLNLTDSDKAVVGTVSYIKTLLQAYHTGGAGQLSTAVDCDAINTPDIVPIAVGIALIALVVVVLIAYLVGRRRSSRGYVSM